MREIKYTDTLTEGKNQFSDVEMPQFQVQL